MTRKGIVWLAALVVAAVHHPSLLAAQDSTTRPVHVAVVSWMIDSVVLKQEVSIAAICLSTGKPRQLNGRQVPMTTGGDLDSLTIAALPKVRLPVHPGKGCNLASGYPLSTVVSGTVNQAARVQVGPVVIDSLGRATLEADYRVHGLWAGGYDCTAVKKSGVWVVESCKGTWVS